MDDNVSHVFEIVNIKGLHARASAKFVETVETYDASADVEKDGLSACGDSIMGLLMLAASKGSSIKVTTQGPERLELMSAIRDLISKRFGEPD